MPKLIICRGLPASGKSTFAKAYVKTHPNTVRINRDELRLMLFDTQFDPKVEDDITAMQDILMGQAFVMNRDIVLDNTNLNPKVIGKLNEWANRNMYTMEYKDFTDVPLSECIARDAKRGAQSVGKKVIQRMHRQFLQQTPDEPAHVPGRPYAIICDIDGTLAHHDNKRDIYDASKAMGDRLDTVVADIILSHYERGDHVIFCSGRDSQYREITGDWLALHDLWVRDRSELLMRPAGDTREDGVVKTDLYHTYIEGKYNIRYCLDDRQRVVDSWRDLGLKCLQVAEGDF